MHTTQTISTLKLEQISFSYGRKPLIDDLSVSLDSTNPMVGLLGSNGCGKTTLLRIICNQLSHKGRCFFDKHSIENMSIREISKTISYIPQKTGIQISMSVLDVVLLGFNSKLGLLQHPSSAMHDAALLALRNLGIEHLQDQDYLSLSEGEKQLCILARTTVEDTSLLLLDEPDSALDFHNKYCMMNTVKHITHQSGKIALMCLHDPSLALDFCDHLILMKNGKIAANVYPKLDSTEKIEAAFTKLYGNVQLMKIMDKTNHSHLILVSNLEQY